MPQEQRRTPHARDVVWITGCSVISTAFVIGVLALVSGFAGFGGMIGLVGALAALFVIGFVAMVIRFRALVGAKPCPQCGGTRLRGSSMPSNTQNYPQLCRCAS